MTEYRLTFDIKGSDKLGIIIAALASEGVTFHVSEHANGAVHHKQPYQTFRNPKNSKTAAIVFDTVAIGQKVNAKTLCPKLEEAGFSPSSLSPTISRLCQSGHLRRLADGSVERVR